MTNLFNLFKSTPTIRQRKYSRHGRSTLQALITLCASSQVRKAVAISGTSLSISLGISFLSKDNLTPFLQPTVAWNAFGIIPPPVTITADDKCLNAHPILSCSLQKVSVSTLSAVLGWRIPLVASKQALRAAPSARAMSVRGSKGSGAHYIVVTCDLEEES